MNTVSHPAGSPNSWPAGGPRETPRSEPRSRKPHTRPDATPTYIVDTIIELRHELTGQGLDAGADTIDWHLQHHHRITVSRATIYRILRRHGLIQPAPRKKPKSSYIRFQAELPNETWQADFTHHRLADGTDTEILTWLDDHSRYALSVTAHQPVTGPDVVTTFKTTTKRHGTPFSTLTDNGMVFTTRFARGGYSSRNGLEERTRPPKRPTKELPTQPPHHLRKKSNDSNKPSNAGYEPNPPPPPSTNSNTNSTPSPPTTTTTAPTDHYPATQPPPSPTTPDQKPNQKPPSPPNTASDTTESTKAQSPCESTANSTTSDSDDPSTEPPSSCSSTTSTSESSTPPPANSCDNSPSTQTAATTAQADPQPPWTTTTTKARTLKRGFGPSMSRDITWSG